MPLDNYQLKRRRSYKRNKTTRRKKSTRGKSNRRKSTHRKSIGGGDMLNKVKSRLSKIKGKLIGRRLFHFGHEGKMKKKNLDPSLLTEEERRNLDAAKQINLKPFSPKPRRFRILSDPEATRMNLDQERQKMQNFVLNYKDLSSRQPLDDAEMARRRLHKQRQQMQNFGRYKWDANTLERMEAAQEKEEEEARNSEEQEQEEQEEGEEEGDIRGGKRKRKRNTKIKKTIKRKKSKKSSRRRMR